MATENTDIMADVPGIKNSNELIVYQVSEVKNLLTSLTLKVDQNQEKLEKRVSALEIWRAGQEELEKQKLEKQAEGKPIDIQKIIIGAFAIVSAAIALLLASVNGGVVK